MRSLRRWLTEPFLHFFGLGAVVLALYHWATPPATTNEIVVSEPVVAALRQDHLQRSGALPSTQEEAALIDRLIDSEVLYRQALALGLDQGDLIIRRRLVQKMQFLTEDMEPIPEPSDSELEAYLETHQERYALPGRVTFTHVFANAERHGEDLERVAEELRERLMAGTDPSGLGDPFLHGREFRLRTGQDVAGMFGPKFAVQVMSSPLAVWSEPLRSSYGLHLVRVTERREGTAPTLARVRTEVRRDWREEQREEANRAALERLRAAYQIHVEKPARTLTEIAFSR